MSNTAYYVDTVSHEDREIQRIRSKEQDEDENEKLVKKTKEHLSLSGFTIELKSFSLQDLPKL